MPSCYAVGAERALRHAAFRARFWRGKVFISDPSKSRFFLGISHTLLSAAAVVWHRSISTRYNCIGAFSVPDRRKIPAAEITMGTRKGVAVSYSPERIAV